MKKIPVGHGKFAIVDDADFERFGKFHWCICAGSYAARRVNGGIVYLHRLVNETPEGMHTDHINGRKLDNRRCNLRTVTHGENMRNILRKDNKARVRGVYRDKAGWWCASKSFNGTRVWLGRFKKKTEARNAYAMRLAA